MKTYFSLLLSGGLLLGMTVSTLAQGLQEHGELTARLAQQLHSMLQADNVLGKPLDFAGLKIIPIVSVGVAFGAGTGAEGEEAMGVGSGGGGVVTPQGLLVITKEGEVRVIGARKGAISELVQGLAPVILESIKTRRGAEKTDVSPAPPSKQ